MVTAMRVSKMLLGKLTGMRNVAVKMGLIPLQNLSGPNNRKVSKLLEGLSAERVFSLCHPPKGKDMYCNGMKIYSRLRNPTDSA